MLLKDSCPRCKKHRACACTQEAATPAESSEHLSELSLGDNVLPLIPGQHEPHVEVPEPAEVPACASRDDSSSRDSTASHNTVHSMGTYSTNSAAPLLKKRKTGTHAERVQLDWGSSLKEYPELRQAALGQWPRRSWKEQGPAAGQAPVGQLFKSPQLHSADLR